MRTIIHYAAAKVVKDTAAYRCSAAADAVSIDKPCKDACWCRSTSIVTIRLADCVVQAAVLCCAVLRCAALHCAVLCCAQGNNSNLAMVQCLAGQRALHWRSVVTCPHRAITLYVNFVADCRCCLTQGTGIVQRTSQQHGLATSTGWTLGRSLAQVVQVDLCTVGCHL